MNPTTTFGNPHVIPGTRRNTGRNVGLGGGGHVPVGTRTNRNVTNNRVNTVYSNTHVLPGTRTHTTTYVPTNTHTTTYIPSAPTRTYSVVRGGRVALPTIITVSLIALGILLFLPLLFI